MEGWTLFRDDRLELERTSESANPEGRGVGESGGRDRAGVCDGEGKLTVVRTTY